MFSVNQAAAITGIGEKLLQYWLASGVVSPTVDLGMGRGNGKKFDLQGLVGLRVVADLRREGVPMQRVRLAVRKLSRLKGKRALEALAASRLVVLPDGDVALCNRDEFVSPLTGQQLMGPIIALDIGATVADVREAVRRAA